MIQSTILLALGFIIILITWKEVQGKDFLVAVHRESFKEYVSISADSEETGGMIQIQYPSYGYKKSLTLGLLQYQHIYLEKKIGTTSGIEYNSILVTCSDDNTKVKVQNYYHYNIFSPLPLTALGTRYIVSSCDRDGQYSPFLVIATGAENTDVDITFKDRGSIRYEERYYRNGDTLSLRLSAYQTFTIGNYYDLTGTIVNSTQNIALFIGLMNRTSVVAYDQLLPLKLYSKEYIVAVDKNTALYNLQIISQDNGTLINFNNRTRAVVDGSGFYRRQLRQNEMFHFTTTSPVMTTLCRLNGRKSGFLVVPPVSRFETQIRIRFPYRETKVVLMTSRNTEINISSSYVSKVWSNIPNSGFKVGILVSRYSTRVSANVPFTGAVLFYHTYSIYSNGISIDVAPVYSDTQGYILAFPQQAGSNLILSAVGETDGVWQVQYPHSGETYNRQTVQYYADSFYIRQEVLVESGVENKTIIVTANSDIHINSFSNDYSKSITFSPLPVSALGKKYMVPTCYDPYVNNSLLVVATAKEMAVVHITFKLGNQSIIYDKETYTNGETLRVRLLEYQTLTIQTSSPLCGTTVSANRNVAVFSGTDDPVSYMQILPVRLHGQEYVVSVQSHPYSDLHFRKNILIIGKDSETQIIFNDMQVVSLGEREFYQIPLLYNESIFFKSTRPVMVSMFIFNTLRQYFTCSIVPPVSFYTKVAVFIPFTRSYIKILTEKSTDMITIKRSIGRSWTEDVSADWTDIPDSNYKVGTYLATGSGILYVNSNTAFTVMGYTYRYRYQGIFTVGYRFHRTSTLPDSTTELSVHETNSTDTDLDLTGQSSVTMAVGITCGVIILVLVVVIAGLVIYIRRMIGSKGKTDDMDRADSSSREQCRQGETAFTSVEKDASSDAKVAVISSGRTYEDLQTEDQTENTYEDFGECSTNRQSLYENS